jgi:saccharopine dehydrogenase (NAD+, L-lysine-forming)
MSKVLIIGAGGVGRVVTHKCSSLPDVFSEIMLASRTQSKCDAIAASIRNRKIHTATVNADNVDELESLINSFKPSIVINVALPYQDLTIMEACLRTGVHYLDTANYESKDTAKFEYKWQWAYHDRFKEKKLIAVLGCGFDPGVSGVWTAYAAKHHFDEIHYLDIIDCNAGDHGKAFATNFNPEINIREITQNGKYWENGQWIEIPPHSIYRDIIYPNIGPRRSYMIYHEELESLVKHFPTIKRARFWMTFSENYLTHLRVIQNIGMDRIDPVKYKGVDVIPIEFLKCLLPDPSSLGENYTGETSIGCLIRGIKDRKDKTYFVWNNCSHAEAYKETGAQAVSYTTGVPAMIGAKMVLEGKWHGHGVFNVEQLNPDPFLHDLKLYGLPWHEQINPDFVID